MKNTANDFDPLQAKLEYFTVDEVTEESIELLLQLPAKRDNHV